MKELVGIVLVLLVLGFLLSCSLTEIDSRNIYYEKCDTTNYYSIDIDFFFVQ